MAASVLPAKPDRKRSCRCRRGPDGRLGVSGSGGNTINVQIATPDLDNFRRSESYITGQIARAVARGQRSL